MKAFLLAVATVALLAFPGDALAGWSAPQTTSVAGYSTTSMAVNARGETVVAWARGTNPGHEFGTATYLTVRTPGGRVRTRRIWSSRRSSTGGIAAAVDGKGEVTVAWIVNNRRNQGGRSGPGKVYAAYGPLRGHWKQRQVVGRAVTKPSLAVAPHGRVLLLWIDGSAESRNLVAAWRTRGHSFRDRKALDRPRVVFTPFDSTGAVPAFDAAGAAYVAGECDAVVLRARPNSHRLRTILDRGPAVSATLSLSGRGRGVAGWVGGSCTSDISASNTPGPVFDSILDRGKFGTVLRLPFTNTAASAHAVAVAGDGAIVSWSDRLVVSSTTVAADGSVAAPKVAPLGIVPLARDGGGDQVLAGPGSGGQSVQFGVLVQPVGGGALEQAPLSYGSLAVSQPEGRRVALAWNTIPTGAGGNLALSVWRP
jgi:hypothetical protein